LIFDKIYYSKGEMMKKYLIIFLGLFLVFGSISVFAGENDVSQTMTISSDEAALLSNVSDEQMTGVEGESGNDTLDAGVGGGGDGSVLDLAGNPDFSTGGSSSVGIGINLYIVNVTYNSDGSVTTTVNIGFISVSYTSNIGD